MRRGEGFDVAEIPGDLRTPKQLARLLGVDATTVRRWLRGGRLRGYKVGGRWRGSEADARGMIRAVTSEGA